MDGWKGEDKHEQDHGKQGNPRHHQQEDQRPGYGAGGRGEGGYGYNLTVGDCNGNYLALRPQPVWDQYHELAHLYPGYQVMTYGQTTRGTGLQGVPCTYTYVYWNGIWGWANSAFLR